MFVKNQSVLMFAKKNLYYDKYLPIISSTGSDMRVALTGINSLNYLTNFLPQTLDYLMIKVGSN